MGQELVKYHQISQFVLFPNPLIRHGLALDPIQGFWCHQKLILFSFFQMNHIFLLDNFIKIRFLWFFSTQPATKPAKSQFYPSDISGQRISDSLGRKKLNEIETLGTFYSHKH